MPRAILFILFIVLGAGAVILLLRFIGAIL